MDWVGLPTQDQANQCSSVEWEPDYVTSTSHWETTEWLRASGGRGSDFSKV